MQCPSPPVNREEIINARLRRSSEKKYLNRRSPALAQRETYLGLRVGFLMDDVRSVRDLAKHFRNLRSTMYYVEDPVFHKFPQLLKLYKGDTLVIEVSK